MSKLRDENYIVIPAWATKEPYNLKGNDLLIFSIIYGFCQHKGQCFCGSIAYLADWTNSSRQGVSKNINSLIKRGLIKKVPSFPTNKYYIINDGIQYEPESDDVNNVDEDVNEVDTPPNKVNVGSEHSLDNNMSNNTKNNIDKYNATLQISSSIEEIIKYMNSVCHTSFKPSTGVTKRLIKSRIREGFSVDDFKSVISFKYKEWGERPVKFNNGRMSTEYLRPTTLFGDNFETYLNESKRKTEGIPIAGKFTSVSEEPSAERSDLIF